VVLAAQVVQEVMVAMDKDTDNRKLMEVLGVQVDLELPGQDVVDMLELGLVELVERMEIMENQVEMVEAGHAQVETQATVDLVEQQEQQ
jgi:putative NIF3 family GTP cyclohydrolase 1 type 2